MCINITDIRLQIFYFIYFVCIFAFDANFYIFMPAHRTLDSLMVKWLYGLVWSVLCCFNFSYLLLSALRWCCGKQLRGEIAFCLCADFLSMAVVCVGGAVFYVLKRSACKVFSILFYKMHTLLITVFSNCMCPRYLAQNCYDADFRMKQ